MCANKCMALAYLNPGAACSPVISSYLDKGWLQWRLFQHNPEGVHAWKELEEKFSSIFIKVTSLNLLTFSLSHHKILLQTGDRDMVPKKRPARRPFSALHCASIKWVVSNHLFGSSTIDGLAKAFRKISWHRGSSSREHGSTGPERSDCHLEAPSIN